jgi:hypothetical protein
MNSCKSSSCCSQEVSSVCSIKMQFGCRLCLGGGAFGGVSDCKSFALV